MRELVVVGAVVLLAVGGSRIIPYVSEQLAKADHRRACDSTVITVMGDDGEVNYISSYEYYKGD